MNCNKKETVLVIGGAGFLGRHIVTHLLNESFISEIRVLDRVPYDATKLGNLETAGQIISIIGDIRRLDDVNAAMRGVSVVIHSASLIDVSIFPDAAALEAMNVIGTQNVIESCILQNVTLLIYTSTIDVVLGFDDIVNGDETLGAPKSLIFPGYGGSKRKAESLIIAANGRPLACNDGSVLYTVSLRPSTMYGEYDTNLVTTVAQAAKSSGGTLFRIGDGMSVSQQAYVGNIAWAHVCAIKAARSNREEVGGQAYFVNDDTPLTNFFTFMEIFLKPCGFRVSKRSIPYWIMYALFFIIEWILSAVYIFCTINLKTSLSSVVYVNRTFYFSRRRAELVLGYAPHYDWDEAVRRSTAYYTDNFKIS